MARKLKSDRILFTATLLLVCASVVMVFSASALVALERFQQANLFVTRQAMWAALGLAVLAIAMRIDYRTYRNDRFVWGVLALVGVMLVAGSKRHLVIADGMPACAALMVASRIAPAVTDYCVYCRSHNHQGLDQALALFHASALLELGMESTDGTGATLAWPLIRSAAALLTEVAEGEDPGPTLPSGIPTLSGTGTL